MNDQYQETLTRNSNANGNNGNHGNDVNDGNNENDGNVKSSSLSLPSVKSKSWVRS